MKLVIEIARKEYERAKKGEWNCTIINKAVANATPLEEVLGEIKEQNDRLVKDVQRISTLYTEEAQEFGRMIEDIKAEIRNNNIADFIATQSVIEIIDKYISGKE